ncbi:MAG TPA: MFS transporter [Gaiellaceae bacterium]|nr:MFS transporter [Gaiellaceae bacterium]
MSRFGPLREREFRLLLAGRTISMAGSAMAPVALAFAVLDVTGSVSDLGIVLAARQIPTVLFVLFGGVWADRLRRHQVMVVSNLVSAAAQAVTAALLILGHAHIWQLAALAAVNGSASAFFFPASTGIVPQTVPSPLLQQANAALRLTLNATNIVGAAIGGILVAATSPGWAIAIDADSYVAASACLGAMHLPAGLRIEGSTVLHELREGWRDFWSRTWLWAIVLQFAIVNAVETGSLDVLGPAVAKKHLGGAGAWGGVLSAFSFGLVLTGVVMLRWRPRRILRTATFGIFPMVLPLVALIRPAPLEVVILASFLAGAGVEVFGVLWDTAMQQQIPPEKLSRLSSYDALGSFVLIPVGLAVAGPVGAAVGLRAAFIGSSVLIAAVTALVLLSRDVRTLERRAT